MKKKKIIVLANWILEEDFWDLWCKTVTIDDYLLVKEKEEYILEKFTIIINQMYYNKWIHLNTVLKLLCDLYENNRLLYSKLLFRVNSFFSFWDFIIVCYNVDDIWNKVLKDINISYRIFNSKESLILFCKNYLCQ